MQRKRSRHLLLELGEDGGKEAKANCDGGPCRRGPSRTMKKTTRCCLEEGRGNGFDFSAMSLKKAADRNHLPTC